MEDMFTGALLALQLPCGDVRVSDCSCAADASMLLIPHGTNESVRVHAGFGIAYASVEDVVLEFVGEQVARFNGHEVVVTGAHSYLYIPLRSCLDMDAPGHSMGGSLAALAGAALKANLSETGLRVFTFGMPCTVHPNERTF